jgi:hypothetical protein
MEAKVLSPKKKEKGEILDELEHELHKSKKKRPPAPADTDGESGQQEMSATAVIAAGGVTKPNKSKESKK